MRRNILYILLLFVALVTLSAIQKPIFLLWYAELVADAGLSGLWGVISSGISLDMTIAGYVCALPILYLLFSIWMPHKALSLVAICGIGGYCRVVLGKPWAV